MPMKTMTLRFALVSHEKNTYDTGGNWIKQNVSQWELLPDQKVSAFDVNMLPDMEGLGDGAIVVISVNAQRDETAALDRLVLLRKGEEAKRAKEAEDRLLRVTVDRDKAYREKSEMESKVRALESRVGELATELAQAKGK